MKTTIDMAREAGFTEGELAFMGDNFRQFAELVRADEQEKYKWDIHSCGPTCKRYACVAMREAVEAEREACAQVVWDMKGKCWAYDHDTIAEAIRARGNT